MSMGRNPYGARSARRGIRNQLAARIIQAGASFAVMLITIRQLTVGEYAFYVTAVAAGTVLGSVSLFGMDRVAFRYIPEGRLSAHPGDLARLLDRLRQLRLALVVGVSLVVAAAWKWIGPLFELHDFRALWPVLCYSIVHAMSQYSAVVMQSLMLQRDLRNATTITWSARFMTLLIVVAVVDMFTALWALWITIASEALGLFWMATKTHGHVVELRTQPSDVPSGVWPRTWSEIYRFGGQNLAMGQLSLAIKPKIQLLVAAALLPKEAVAAFGFFRSLSDQFARLLPFHMFRTIIEPIMMGRFRSTGDFSQQNTIASAILKTGLLLSLPVSVWAFLAGKPVVSMITSGKFVGETWMFGLLVLSLVPTIQRTLHGIIANAADLSAALIPAAVIGSLATVLLAWSWAPLVGAVAIVVSDIVFAAVFGFVVVRALRGNGLSYSVDWGAVVRMYALAILAAGVAGALHVVVGDGEPLLWSIGAALVIGLIVLGGNLVWRPFTAAERELLSRVVPRRLMIF